MSRKSPMHDGSQHTDLHEKMIRLFCERGPLNHADIARRLSISKSSVDRYYNRLLRGRIAFKPNVNRWVLGLRRVVLRVTFFPEFEDHARDICKSLAHLAYLAYFAKLMPENEWQIQFQVPIEHQGKLWQFLTRLVELRVLSVREIYQTDVHCVAPFQTDQFDFEKMKFDFDWQTVENPTTLPDTSHLYGERIPFDLTDLKILESMQREPMSIAEISRQAGLNRWTCYWHWQNRIWGKIIRDWFVFWVGTLAIDQVEARALSRRELTCINLFAKSLSSSELQALRERLHSLPYLWSEIIGESDIVAQLFFPNKSLANAYKFLSTFEDSLKSKIVIRTEDQRNAILYTVPSHLYDENNGWTFDFENLTESFGRLAHEVRENRLRA